MSYLDKYFPKQNQVDPAGDYYDGMESEDGLLPEELWAEEMEGDAEGDYPLEGDEGMVMEEALPQLSDKQARLAKWLQEHNPQIQGNVEKVQMLFDELQYGIGGKRPEDQQKHLQQIDSLLSELETELQMQKVKEVALENTGLKEEEVLGDAALSEGFEEGVKKLQENFSKEKQKIDSALEETAKAEAEAAEKKKERETLAAEVIDLQGYLGGSKGRVYFSAEAEKRNNGSYGLVEVYGSSDSPHWMFTHISNALKADNEEGWNALNQYLRGLIGPSGKAMANMATVIIQENLPELWDHLPAESLRNLTQALSSQGDSRKIYSYGDYEKFMKYRWKANTAVFKNSKKGRLNLETEMSSKEAFDLLTDLAMKKEKEAEEKAKAEAEAETEVDPETENLEELPEEQEEINEEEFPSYDEEL